MTQTAPLADANVYSVAVDAQSGASVLYAGVSGAGVFQSADQGAHWTATADADPGGAHDIRSLAVDTTTTPHTLWVGTGAGTASYSSDPFNGFTSASAGLPAGWGNEVHLIADAGRVVAGVSNINGTVTTGGGFAWAGASWTALPTAGLPDQRMRDLVFGPGGVLHAATAAGAYELDASSLGTPPGPSGSPSPTASASPSASASPTPGPTSPPTPTPTPSAPTPVITSVSPASAPVCTSGCSDVIVSVTGTGWDVSAGGDYRLDGTLLQKSSANGTSQAVVIPASLLSTARTAALTVTTGGGTSSPFPFFVTDTAAAVTEVATGSDVNGTISLATTDGGYTAQASGDGVVSLAEYASNPVAVAPPAGASNFFDVHVDPSRTITTLTVVDCDLSATNTTHVVSWFDGTAWSPVSNQSYDSGTGCVTLTFTASSTPNFTALVGTVFADGPDPKAVTLGPAAPEGAFRISAGDWIAAGVHFKLTAKSTQPVQVQLSQASFTLPVTCGDGTSSRVRFALRDLNVSVPKGSTAWYATADKASPSGFLGAQLVSSPCAGARTTSTAGATVTTRVTASPAVAVSIAFHYRDPRAKGKRNVNCSDPGSTQNPEPGTADCAAGWTEAVTK
jgi:hypothetical protein